VEEKENQAPNKIEQCSIPSGLDGLGAREEGLSIDVYQPTEQLFGLA